jgi:hypothetical protein
LKQIQFPVENTEISILSQDLITPERMGSSVEIKNDFTLILVGFPYVHRSHGLLGLVGLDGDFSFSFSSLAHYS